MITSDYQNTIDQIKLLLLRNPMVVPKWGHTDLDELKNHLLPLYRNF